MKIDIVQLAEIISALALIGGVVFGVFKFIENNKKQNAEINKIDKYLNQSAHSAEDLN